MKKLALSGSIAALVLSVLPARAAVLTWDTNPLLAGPGDGLITGGSGTWTTTAGVGEWTLDGGANNVSWVNANLDQAVFGDVAGVVTLGSPISANALTFNTTGYSIASNTLTLAGTTPTITAGAGIAATISSTIAGTGGVLVTGGGSITLSALNTITGGTTVSGGSTLILSTGGATGALRDTITVNAGSTLRTTAGNALGYAAGVKVTTLNLNNATFDNVAVGDQGWANTINLTGSLMRSNGGTNSAAATQLFSLGGGTVINSLASSTTSTIQGRINLREGNTNDQLVFNVSDGAAATDLLVSASITANATSRGIVKNGAGTMQLSGPGNTWQGNFDINGGTVVATVGTALGANNGTRQITLNNAGTVMNWTINNVIVGAGSNAGVLPTLNLNAGTTLNATRYNAIGNLNLNGGTLNQSATDGPTYQGYQYLGTVTVGGAAASTISSGNGKGNHLRGNATITFNVGDVTASSATDLLVSNPILNGSGDYAGTGSLLKSGTGTMTLTAANLYTGSTSITNGTLALTGAGSLASTNVIATNGGVFDVSGTTSGTFTLVAGQTLTAGRTSGAATDVIGNVISSVGTVNVAGTGAAGTFTLGGSLTLSGGTMAFDLAATNDVGGGINDLAIVQNLNLSGLSSIAINKITGALASSTYTLINYTGSLTGNASNLTLTGAAGGTTRQAFALDTTTAPGSVLLNVTGSSANLVWVGDGVSNVWDINGAVNWTGAGDGNNRFFDGDSVTINDTGSNTVPLALGVTVRPSSFVVDNPTKNYTIAGAGAIGGTTGLTKSGNGKLTLGTSNTFTGPVTVNAGTVSVATLANAGAASGLGAGTSIALGDSTNVATLEYTGLTTTTNRPLVIGDAGARIDVTTPATVLTATGGISGNGSLTKVGNGALTVNSVISTTSSVTVDAGTLTLLNAQNTYTGGTTVNNGATLVLTGANSPTGVIRGTLTINPGGTVNTTTPNALGYGAGVHVDNLNIVGGLLNNTATGDQGWNINITLTEGTLRSNGGVSDIAAPQYFSLGGVSSVNTVASANPSTISGRINLREGNPNDQLTFNIDDGAAAVDLEVSAAITANAATRGILKTGSGNLVLGGVMTYAGTTSITGGKLTLGAGASLASTLVNVGAGATFDVSAIPGFGIPSGSTVNVSPDGFFQGPAEVAAGATLIAGRSSSFATDFAGPLSSSGTIRVAGNGIPGTLSISNGLTLNDGGTLNFDLSDVTTTGDGINDLITVSGGLTLGGTTTIAVNRLAGNLTAGTYELINYSGALVGNASNFALSGLVTTGRQTFTVNTGTLGSVQLTVAGGPATLVWTGDGLTNPWDLSTQDWNNAGNADRFFDLDHVSFTDAGSNTPNVVIDVPLVPGSVTVNNSVKDYTFSGAGSITGATGLTKEGTARLTIGTTNSFTGAVEINDGVVSVATLANLGLASPLGAGTVLKLGGASTRGTLEYTGTTSSTNRTLELGDVGGGVAVTNGATQLTLSGLISGPGEFTKSGAGTLVLSNANNSFAGNVVIDGGTVIVPTISTGANSALGLVVSGGRTITVNSGALLSFTTNNVFGQGVGNPNLPAIVLNGSTLSSTRYTAIGDLTLNGATLTQSATDNGAYEGYQFIGAVNVIGSVPSTIVSPNGKGNHLGANTVFTVADVTGSAATDLTISAPLRDQSGDFGTADGILTKDGAGTLAINGVQSYSALTNLAGRTVLNTSLPDAVINGDGGSILFNANASNSTVNANAGHTSIFAVSQTLAALNIGDGGTVELNDAPAPAPALFAAEEAAAASGVTAVPEPGVASLLMFGALSLFGHRRRRA